MSKNFLLEIGLEEMPAHVVTPSMEQLQKKIESFLKENRLVFERTIAYSTPRRLAVKVVGLASKQADIEEEVKGPAKKIALDADANWSKAAQGFVRGQGVTTDDITFKELKGVEYVYVEKFVKGQDASEVLRALPKVITSLTFPVSMHWANYQLKYIRPIHWLIALLDDEVIPFEILDNKTGNHSRGHRFLGKDVAVKHADDYETALASEYVIVDPVSRKEKIKDQITNMAEKNHWEVVLDASLLEEVNNLVEYPTAFAGSFDEKYLNVPEEVLVTSMKEHQRYFEVRDAKQALLPYFISVRNGNEKHIENVVKGNQKVLTARLEDAEFFYQEDQKISIESYVEKLKHVTFHEKIGTLYEKMQRVGKIAEIIGTQVGLSEEEAAHLKRASSIYKFDLVTNMVGEFPELQGIMGEKYALLQGENAAVARAIREHYLPNSSNGELPKSKIGALLAIADKLDSVLSFFSVGMIPNGSNDPYALRRQTFGIIRIVEEKGWKFPIIHLHKQIVACINENLDEYGIAFSDENSEIIEFIRARMKQRLSAYDIRHDVIDAAVYAEQDDVQKVFEAAKMLKEHLNDDDFRGSIEALTRVINLAKKAEIDPVTVNPSLFENPSEERLFKEVEHVKERYTDITLNEKYMALKNLRPYIAAYFDETMVMSENKEIKKNRLAQLKEIAQLVQNFASLDLLVVK